MSSQKYRVYNELVHPKVWTFEREILTITKHEPDKSSSKRGLSSAHLHA